MNRGRACMWALLAAGLLSAPVSAGAQTRIVTKTVPVQPALKSSLGVKPTWNRAKVASKITYRKGTPLLDTGGGEVFALLPTTLVQPTPPTAVVIRGRKLAAVLKPYEQHITATPYLLDARPAKPPLELNSVSHRARQTPVRNQRSRGTCTAFAALAALESSYKRTFGLNLDLSEEHAFSIFNEQGRRMRCSDDGFPLSPTAEWLSSNRVCSEVNWRYALSADFCNPLVPAVCTQNSSYYLDSFEPILSRDDAGETPLHANNTNLLEGILTAGYEIVYAVHTAGDAWHENHNRLVDVQFEGGSPAPSYGGHAMLMVGFNRSGNYFEFKNSWGTGKGFRGYMRLTYEYVQTYGMVGYYVTRVDR